MWHQQSRKALDSLSSTTTKKFNSANAQSEHGIHPSSVDSPCEHSALIGTFSEALQRILCEERSGKKRGEKKESKIAGV